MQYNLLDIPHGPHYLEADIDLASLTSYKDDCAISRRFRYELHSQRSLGIDLDLVDTEKWRPPSVPTEYHPDDYKLIMWEANNAR